MPPPIDEFPARALGLGVLVLANVVLAKLLPITRRDVQSAVWAGLAVGAVDVAIEAAAGALGVWRYSLSLSVLGIPVDLLFDISLVALALGLGYAVVGRRDRAWRVGYVLVTTFAIGSFGMFHNTQAAAQGMIRFARAVDVGTPWFVFGNYVLVLVLVLGTMLANRIVSTRREASP